jgi:sugar lactone lactonase YvrE
LKRKKLSSDQRKSASQVSIDFGFTVCAEETLTAQRIHPDEGAVQAFGYFAGSVKRFELKEAEMFRTEPLLKVVLVCVACIGCLLQGSGAVATASGIPGQALGRVTTVVTFDATQSEFPEGLAIDKEGNIYAALTFTGCIWKMTPNGTQSILATLDVRGGLLVGLAVDEDGALYVCNATFEPATHGIWKVERNGSRRLFAAFYPTGFPNAMAFDEAGNLFVSDSSLGQIWKISRTGEAKVWLKDPLLAPLTNFGANGIEFDRDDLYVANTDQGSIVRIEISEDDQPQAEVFVQAAALVGADGIAFDSRHMLYVPVDVANALVRITPKGDITTLATPGDGLDYPASTSFDQRPGQRRFLFWTNGGINVNTPSIQKMDVNVPGAPLP